MKIFVWILHILLGVAFVFFGFGKISTPYEEMAAQMGWVQSFSPGMIKFFGVLDISGGLGLLLPYLIKALPRILVPLAGLGLTLLMTGALITHLLHDEFVPMGIANIILGSIAAFVGTRRYRELKQNGTQSAEA